MLTIKDQTQVQISLDRCTGEHIIKLRAVAKTITDSYDRLNRFRIAYIAACASIIGCPAAKTIAATYLPVEKGIQTLAKVYWQKQKKTWSNPFLSSCSIPWMTHKSNHPDFPFTIIQGNESDLANPLSAGLNREIQFVLSLKYNRLYSSAALKNTGVINNEWTVRWSK